LSRYSGSKYIPLFMVLLFVFVWLLMFHEVPEADLYTGYTETADITGIDMESTIVVLPGDVPWYPGRIYSPEEFSAGAAEEPGSYRGTGGSSTASKGTYRLKVHAKPGEGYLLTGYSLDYSMRVYSNGIRLTEVGCVGDDAGSGIPRVNYFTVPVITDENGDIELVINYSNFWHNDGGSLPELRLGRPELIEQYCRENDRLSCVVSGGFLFMAIYMLLLFVLDRKTERLLLSLCSLLFALRNTRFYIKFLLPYDYNWFIHYRFTVLFLVWIPFTECLLFSRMTRDAKIRGLEAVYSLLVAVLTALIFILDTHYTVIPGAVGVAAGVLAILLTQLTLLVRCIKRRRFGLVNSLAFWAMAWLLLAALVECRFIRTVPLISGGGITPYVMLMFLFVVATVSDEQRRQTDLSLERARQEREYMSRREQLRSEFLSEISHEMRTPLAVISGYAQKVRIKLGKTEGIPPEIINNLTFISNEAQRLGALADRLTVERAGRGDIASIRLQDMSESFASIAAPVLQKNGNEMYISIPADLPPVRGNSELLKQILFNLLTNANRHSKNDAMLLKATRTESGARLQFIDHGDGMDAETREAAFDRGFSRDGSSGLGLMLCREIVEAMGGSISLESEPGKGTTITIELAEAK